MRVTIEHRETTAGMLGNHKDCYLDCRVDFNEEEKAIIKQRDLYGLDITVRAATPEPTNTQFLNTGLMRVIARVMMVAGVIWGLAGGGVLTGLLFFAGAGLEIYSWIRNRTDNKRAESSDQVLTVKRLLGNPTFTVHAFDPAAAKGFELQVRDQLKYLKNAIADSAELRAKQTFEL
jgi:hypothetical protein